MHNKFSQLYKKMLYRVITCGSLFETHLFVFLFYYFLKQFTYTFEIRQFI